MKLFNKKQAVNPAVKGQVVQSGTGKSAVVKDQKNTAALGNLEKGMVSLVDIISPSSVEVDFRYIRVGERFYTTLFMVGYPRFVSPTWLQPIVDYDHTMDITMFCYPTSSSDILADLRRKIGELGATIMGDEESGKMADPKVQAALEDALALQEELAKGVERFFQFSFYITVSAESLPDLTETSKQLQTTLSSLLLTAKSATLQMEEGFKSTLPMASDKLMISRNMDTTSLASTFPFTSATLTQNKGVMYGINQQNGSLIIFDRFSLENANEVVLGKSGAGKSYLIKLEIMRQFMLGAEVTVIDPEGEYKTLAETLGGEVIEFSANSPVKINPFDLSDVYEEGENELGLKILSLNGLLKIIMGQLDPAHDAILDKALVETYRSKGITPDPLTQRKAPPLMEDLYKTLLGMEDPSARELAFRLEKFIKGSVAGIFNQPSNIDIVNPLTIFNIRNLEEELRPIAMHIILDFIWTKVKKTLKKRLLILDEAWYMMKYQDSASYVYSIAKRARKYYLGLTTATQDVEDFMSTDYGKAVLTNSSIQMLLKQGTAEVEMISQVFNLSEGERELLVSADIGEGLFFAGQNHVAMKVLAAFFEHSLITSNPEEIMAANKVASDAAASQQADAEALSAMLNTPTPLTPSIPPVPVVTPILSPTPALQIPPIMQQSSAVQINTPPSVPLIPEPQYVPQQPIVGINPIVTQPMPATPQQTLIPVTQQPAPQAPQQSPQSLEQQQLTGGYVNVIQTIPPTSGYPPPSSQ